jgi:phage terminase Nu1 subunit (DNA packaging protein)
MSKKNATPDIIVVAKKKRHMHLLQKMQQGKALSQNELKELQYYEGPLLPPGIVRTQREVAKALKISNRTIESWVANGMPKTEEGDYDLIEIKAWRDSRNEKKPTSSEKEKSDIEYRKLRNELIKIELKKRRGELIEKDKVIERWLERIKIFKKALLFIPRSCAPLVAGLEAREAEHILKNCVTDILKELSREK